MLEIIVKTLRGTLSNASQNIINTSLYSADDSLIKPIVPP